LGEGLGLGGGRSAEGDGAYGADGRERVEELRRM
jgi:hypothetical protein